VSQRVRFSAVSAVPLERLTFVLNGRPLDSLGAPPYEAWWQLEPGEFRLEVVGWDGEGHEHRSEAVSFQVLQ
jgi:hypothetical protein